MTLPGAAELLRRWWGLPAGALLLVGLVTFAEASTAASAPADSAPTETVTYEITGPAGVSADIQYGDVYSQAYSPYVATRLGAATLPWRLTVPLRGPISSHDLDARSVPPGSRITCTVRRGGAVVQTKSASGLVGCDTKPR